LAKGTNEWVCVPGNENKIGEPPMCMNPMGMRWMMDAMQGKPKPTNESPGMVSAVRDRCRLAATGFYRSPANTLQVAAPGGEKLSFRISHPTFKGGRMRSQRRIGPFWSKHELLWEDYAFRDSYGRGVSIREQRGHGKWPSVRTYDRK
jgi:hypothetical protein